MTMMAAPTAIALLTMVLMSAASIASLQLTVTATGSDMPAAAADQRATRLEQSRGVQAQHASMLVQRCTTAALRSAALQLAWAQRLATAQTDLSSVSSRRVQVLASPYAFSAPIGLLPDSAAAAAEAHSNAPNKSPQYDYNGDPSALRMFV
jgi:hypothetical protein